jgi:hypothetical protein
LTDNLYFELNLKLIGEIMYTFKIFFLVLVYMSIIYSQDYSQNLNWSMRLISDLKTGYDYQSYGSAQQVWLDINNPENLHAVFIYSAVADYAWADRTSLYFGSTDAGESWFQVGAVPVNNGTTGRSGYPSIVGTSDGRAVISNHNNSSTHPTRSTVFIDNSPFANNFTEYDPGTTPFGQGEAIWPKLAINANDDIVLLSSINNEDSFYVNILQNSVFSGWQVFNGEQAQTHSINFSDGGKVGLAWIGELNQAGNVFYVESTDDGLTWSLPTTVWQAYTDFVTENTLGCFRGVDLSFNSEVPCVVFEVGWRTNAVEYHPELPSEIRFWSPEINGGDSKVLSDSSNVPFYPNLGIADQQFPLSRPVIGRAQIDDYLFVAFNATTGDYWPGASSADSTAYMCGMFMYSSDAGNTWSIPERFTPITSPLLDWRFVSIVPVSPVNNNYIQVHLVMQGDPMPGSTLNGWSLMPPSISAQYYHFSIEPLVINVKDEQSSISSFNLEQNYPNPFNPSTKIKFAIPSNVKGEMLNVSLKVYDALGNEIATLVNEELTPGEYEVEFNTSYIRHLPSSGIYFYTIRSGDFLQTNKMILLK